MSSPSLRLFVSFLFEFFFTLLQGIVWHFITFSNFFSETRLDVGKHETTAGIPWSGHRSFDGMDQVSSLVWSKIGICLFFRSPLMQLRKKKVWCLRRKTAKKENIVRTFLAVFSLQNTKYCLLQWLQKPGYVFHLKPPLFRALRGWFT